jgi:hypothetical protein
MLFNPDWLVVAGEESGEAALQNERIFGALEAIYPRLSNIPPKKVSYILVYHSSDFTIIGTHS